MTAPISFPLFPHDLLVGAALMDDTQFGIYVRLLCHQWTSGGLPNDEGMLCLLISGDFIPSIVMKKFKLCEDGMLRNRRMEIERAKLVQGQKDETSAMLNGEMDAYCKRERIHESLRVHGFPDAWRDWNAYRSQTGKPLTSMSSRQVMQNCERWGAKKATRIIRRAIEFSWINLRDDDEITVSRGEIKTIPPRKLTLFEEQIAEVKRLLASGTPLHDHATGFLCTLSDASLQAYFSNHDQQAITDILKGKYPL